MPRLLLVSNRLPVTVRAELGRVEVGPSAGGLATGLLGPHRESGGLWIGWPGDTSELAELQLSELTEKLRELRCVPLFLSAQEVARYYDGFCNRVLWPLFHYLLDRLPLQPRGFDVYQKVNARFAEAAAKVYRPGDLIWVHDYQLTLVPQLLRASLPSARIGFFLHIPFPSPDVFRALPWRRQLLEGMLGADVVGFHTQGYVRHFSEAVEELLGLEAHGRVAWQGRQVRVGAFPMGIDVASFEALARSPETARELERIRKSAQGRSLLVGVDRLDYTKGIRRRLLAVERFLARNSDLRARVRFVQVAVPSRTHVDAYAAFRRDVDEHVGRINGTYGTPTAVPIHYLFRAVPPAQLSALYRAADVMLVTPVRDGMNLVAKEFVASRVDDDGVLILSELAGAAAELPEALQVNPYDVEGVASMLERALRLGPDERRWRMRSMRARVRQHTARAWVDSFLAAMEPGAGAQPAPAAELSTPGELTSLLDALAAAPERLLLLDYDGTLVPIAARPELAGPPEAVRVLLTALAGTRGTHVHIVSGRPREALSAWLADLPIALHAEHGLWTKVPGADIPWEETAAPDLAWMAPARALLEAFAARTPGTFVEVKTAGLAWHYRQAAPAQAELALAELLPELEQLLIGTGAEPMAGKRVLEVKPKDVHKGRVVAQAMEGLPGGTLVFAAGDDATDEDLFKSLPPGGISVHVGRTPSQARYRLEGPAELWQLLQELVRRLPERGDLIAPREM